MRKKQVLALLLSGALTFSMAPAAVYAEDVSALSIEDVSDAAVETASEAPAEEPAPEEPAETPTETPAEEPTETPVEEPTETPTEAPEEIPTEAPTEAPAEIEIVVPDTAEGNLKEGETATPTPTEKAKGTFTLNGESYSKLEDALSQVKTTPEDTSTDVIYVNESITISEPIVIPQGIAVTIAAPDKQNIQISRGAFDGNMFEVKGSFLYFGMDDLNVSELGIEYTGMLEINGSGDGSVSAGSIVSVSDSGNFGLYPGCKLTGNNTSTNGSAIRCDKNCILYLGGGSITGNKTSGDGVGAIYSASSIYVEGNVSVTGNTDADGSDSNIVLDNTVTDTDADVLVFIYGEMDEASRIGVKLQAPAEGVPVLSVAPETDTITIADAFPYFIYEGNDGFEIDKETGLLKLKEVPTEAPEEVELEAKITDGSWLSTNKVKLTVTSNKDATVYIKVVKTGTKAPTADEIKKDNHKTTVSANKTSAITYTFSTSEKTAVGTDGASIYLCFIDNTGEAVVVSKDMDPAARPPKLTGVDASWTGHDSATVIFQSDKSGTYYWTYGTDSTAPAIEKCTKGAALAANANTPIYVEGITTEGTIYVYIYVKSDSGLVSAPLVAELQSKSRPAAPTQTPTRDPKVPAVTESTVTGLEKPLEFYPNTFYPFTVSGAGMDNTDPIEGDVRWNPLYWSTSSNPSDSEKHSTWKIGAAGGIKKAATYNLYIFYRQEKYTGNEWRATDNISSVAYQFQSAAIEFDDIQITPGANGTYSYYDEDGNLVTRDADGNLISRTDDTTDTGSATATGANTADESPVGTMGMLAVLSLLAGGYVLVRKRKRITE